MAEKRRQAGPRRIDAVRTGGAGLCDTRNKSLSAVYAGGEWEQGIRAVREIPNILIETSGFDATAGFIEMAIRDLGAKGGLFLAVTFRRDLWGRNWEKLSVPISRRRTES